MSAKKQMNLVHECSFKASLRESLPIGTGPVGTRIYYDVTGGEFAGDRLNGKILGGGEWALMGPDGFLRLDVRMQIETHDGAYLYLQYFGLLGANDTVQNALATGGETGFEDQYFYTNPRFETGDERYAWLNQTFFVGQGRIAPDLSVEYHLFRPA